MFIDRRLMSLVCPCAAVFPVFLCWFVFMQNAMTMSSGDIPTYLRNPDHPPPNLAGRSRRNYIHNARKALQNHRYRTSYLPFTVPPTFYSIHHLHRFTPLATFNMVLEHFASCRRFSIDTESDQYTRELSLVQIHSIPHQLPSFVVLLAINHLPAIESPMFTMIRSLFELLFRSGTSLYTWGFLLQELSSLSQFDLIPRSIHADLMNLQGDFDRWYRGALPPCEVCSPSTRLSSRLSVVASCVREKNFPYDDLDTPWSLQNAVLYTSGCCLDKSATKQAWSRLLDPLHSSFPLEKLDILITYAVYDCLSVTYLHKPIENAWKLTQLRDVNLVELFTTVQSFEVLSWPMSMGLEEISEDELPVVAPAERNPDDIRQNKRFRSCRSVSARKRSNQRRNLVHRQRRDQHVMLREVYHRFNVTQIKTILRQRKVQYVHLVYHKDRGYVSIGVKKPELIAMYFDLIPGNLFNRDHYHTISKHRS